MWRTILLLAALVEVIYALNCVRRKSKYKGDHDGHYCVCNSTYCDIAPTVVRPNNPAKYTLITSSKSGLRFKVTNGFYGNIDSNDLRPGKIVLHPEMRYQRIIGFGGAITDSAGFNIYSLSREAADNLLKTYFDWNGIEYNLLRAPMAGSDFSWRAYSYLMKENDTTLSSFSLKEEDYYYKIPVIKRAQQLTHGRIKVLTAPWTAPPWMKTVKSWKSGSLRPEYRQLWADYFVKYFKMYRDLGIEFWSLSAQNEPLNYIYIKIPTINAMRWTAEEESDWIMNYLLPVMKTNGFEHVKILIAEENRLALPEWPQKILKNATVREAISGIALHWYFDKLFSPELLDQVKRQFPEKLLMYTEAALEIEPDPNNVPPVVLGSWLRGEKYAKSIIENMSHWVSSWIDWNIALNLNGGPLWVNNSLDSPIIVNEAADEFYKQPMFYVLGHFSKYVPAHSVRIGSTSMKTEGIDNVAFSTPDGGIVLVILNRNEVEKKILIKDKRKGGTLIRILGKSIITMKYW